MKIKVNGETWTLEVISSKQMKKHREDGECLAGLCIPADRVIYIAEDSMTLATVAHELYHSYFSYLYLSDTNDIHLDDLEEITATLFTERGEEMLKQAKTIYRQLSKGKR